jgi:hypothetical protein
MHLNVFLSLIFIMQTRGENQLYSHNNHFYLVWKQLAIQGQGAWLYSVYKLKSGFYENNYTNNNVS